MSDNTAQDLILKIAYILDSKGIDEAKKEMANLLAAQAAPADKAADATKKQGQEVDLLSQLLGQMGRRTSDVRDVTEGLSNAMRGNATAIFGVGKALFNLKEIFSYSNPLLMWSSLAMAAIAGFVALADKTKMFGDKAKSAADQAKELDQWLTRVSSHATAFDEIATSSDKAAASIRTQQQALDALRAAQLAVMDAELKEKIQNNDLARARELAALPKNATDVDKREINAKYDKLNAADTRAYESKKLHSLTEQANQQIGAKQTENLTIKGGLIADREALAALREEVAAQNADLEAVGIDTQQEVPKEVSAQLAARKGAQEKIRRNADYTASMAFPLSEGGRIEDQQNMAADIRKETDAEIAKLSAAITAASQFEGNRSRLAENTDKLKTREDAEAKTIAANELEIQTKQAAVQALAIQQRTLQASGETSNVTDGITGAQIAADRQKAAEEAEKKRLKALADKVPIDREQGEADAAYRDFENSGPPGKRNRALGEISRQQFEERDLAKSLAASLNNGDASAALREAATGLKSKDADIVAICREITTAIHETRAEMKTLSSQIKNGPGR